MTWTVCTLELPAISIKRDSYTTEESGWLGYLGAIHVAEQYVADADDDLVVGVDLRHDEQLVEQHWITLSRGMTTTGRLTR